MKKRMVLVQRDRYDYDFRELIGADQAGIYERPVSVEAETVKRWTEVTDAYDELQEELSKRYRAVRP